MPFQADNIILGKSYLLKEIYIVLRGETRLRTFFKFYVCAQFGITIAHTTYVNKVLRLRTLKKYMLIVPLPLARYKLHICCPLLTTGRWKKDFRTGYFHTIY